MSTDHHARATPAELAFLGLCLKKETGVKKERGKKAADRAAKQQTKKRKITNKRRVCVFWGPPCHSGRQKSPRDLAQEGSATWHVRVRVPGCTPPRASPCFRGARRRRLRVCASQVMMETTMMLENHGAGEQRQDGEGGLLRVGACAASDS